MQYRSLLSSLSKIGSLGQTNHFGAIFALSSSLVLAACGGGGSAVTENNLAEPGADGVAPTLTAVTLTTVESGIQFAKLGETVKVSFTASESLMTPTMTINGVEAEMNGQNKAWSGTRLMAEADTDGMVTFSISYEDVSGEAGTAVSTSTMASNDDGSPGSWAAVEYCADGSCVAVPVVVKTIDFEDSPTIAWKDIGTATGDVVPGASILVADPDNAENTVAFSTVYAGSAFYGGAYLVMGNAIAPDLTVNLSTLDPIISIRVRPSAIGKEVRLKLEQSDNNSVFVEAKTYTSVEGEWETLYFDFSDPAAGSIDPAVSYGAFFLIYDYAKNAPAADQSWHWDDITHGGVVSGGPVAPPEPPSEFASWGGFGDASGAEDTYSFPTGAQVWAGFANTNSDLYPMTFPLGGKVSFTAAIPEGGLDTTVKFTFEDVPGGSPGFAFSTDTVVVSGSTETTYMVEFDAPASTVDLTSFLMFIVERDSPVIIKNVKAVGNGAGLAAFAAMGNTTVVDDLYTWQTGAEDWGGFANTNTSLYPFSFASGGTITFTAAATADGETSVRFTFENDAYPDTVPNFTTTPVTVSGTDEKVYSVDFSAQAADQTFKSFLMYLADRDVGVVIKDVAVTPNTLANFGAMGNTTVLDGVYTWQTGAEAWGGFANTNSAIYPFSFANGGSISFKAAATADGETSVRFTFENDAYPDTVPNFTTIPVTVSGTDETVYTVDFPAQAADQTFKSLLMYLADRDIGVAIKDVKVTPNTLASFGAMGNTTVLEGVYTWQTGSEEWGGFANTNSAVYPFSFANGGTVTFRAAATADGETDVRFTFENDVYPDTTPNFTTTPVTVSGTDEAAYSVDFPAQAAGQTYKSLLMYLADRDIGVAINTVKVTAN
jgi:hypothetical protein